MNKYHVYIYMRLRVSEAFSLGCPVASACKNALVLLRRTPLGHVLEPTHQSTSS